jgi:hypothetical protein
MALLKVLYEKYKCPVWLKFGVSFLNLMGFYLPPGFKTLAFSEAVRAYQCDVIALS